MKDLYTYFDDIDICLRARRAGWETWYVPASKVDPPGGASTGVSHQAMTSAGPHYWFQARRRFFLKNYGGLYTALADAAFLLGFATLADAAADPAQAGYSIPRTCWATRSATASSARDSSSGTWRILRLREAAAPSRRGTE